jgi:hypothetical protein
MGDHPRKSDVRRVSTPEFKRETVQRLLRDEITPRRAESGIGQRSASPCDLSCVVG